ncbi:MAG: CHC2 zinc finger domain-containing protein, partial [Blastocatellia bacterium]
MRLPRGFADEVKNQSDIVRVISDYVTLKKRGANHMACCPFHSEKTPSFNVHPGKGIYKCFGCSAGGNVFDFVEAVERLAARCGITLRYDNANVGKDRKRKERLGEAVGAAIAFYHR